MTDIVSVLNLINYGFVLIFGIIVSFYFAGIQWEDNKCLFYTYYCIICSVSGIILRTFRRKCPF